jgi:hypothetical protein
MVVDVNRQDHDRPRPFEEIGEDGIGHTSRVPWDLPKCSSKV